LILPIISHLEAVAIVEGLSEAVSNPKAIDDIIGYLYRTGDMSIIAPLLDSPKPSYVRLGAYIMGEVGGRAYSLRDQAKDLLSSPDDETRYWAMCAVANTFEAAEGNALISAAGLYEDTDEFIRIRAAEITERMKDR
jgi:hypothetical protein